MAHPTNTRFAVAVHLLTLLADAPAEMVDSAALSISPATNPVHVRRVLGVLRDKGLVRSQPGAHGGWVLNRPPEQIDLGEVWRAVNGDDPVLGLHDPDPNCPTGRPRPGWGRKPFGDGRGKSAQAADAIPTSLFRITVIIRNLVATPPPLGRWPVLCGGGTRTTAIALAL
jgi:Rrf2 family protein